MLTGFHVRNSSLTSIIRNKPGDSITLVRDTAIGNPPSVLLYFHCKSRSYTDHRVLGVGPAVLLANWILNDTSDTRFLTAASQQLDCLLNYSPRAMAQFPAGVNGFNSGVYDGSSWTTDNVP